MNNTKEIGGRQYSFGTIPATEAVEVEIAVAKVIGEPLFKAFTTESSDDPEDIKATGMRAMAMLASGMNAKDLLATMTTCLKYTTCDGERIKTIDSHFTGKNRDLWLVFFESLKFNFSDFLPASLFDSIKDKVKLL